MLSEESDSSSSLGELWQRACIFINRTEARFLLQKVTDCSHTDLLAHSERKVTNTQESFFELLVQRRKAGEPMAYLLEEAPFYDLDFIVSPEVLIPREDTRVLVDQAAEWIRTQGAKKIRVLELGTGSGIIAIMLARFFPAVEITAIDISEKALRIAQKNAQKHQVSIRFLLGSWFEPVKNEFFDLIVSNPPYVAYGDPHLLHDGLPYEPQIALTDGIHEGKGLFCIRHIIENAHIYLMPGGELMIEHGYDQAEEVRALMRISGYKNPVSRRDGANIERVSSARKPD